MKILITLTGLLITGTILNTTSYAYTIAQSQQNFLVQKIGKKIETIINRKTPDTYKKIELYLLIQDKLSAYADRKPSLKNIIKQINLYLQKDYLPELGIVPIQIKYIVDGDTINFINLNNGRRTSLRMIGIDTPESNKKRYGYVECYGKEAKEHLKELTRFKEPYAKYFIEIDSSQGQVDKYGRTLGYLLQALKYKNGVRKIINLNGKQIQDGYAWEYTYNKYIPYKYQTLFRKYQKQAATKQLGLWNPNTCNGKRIPIEQIKQDTSDSLINILNYPSREELESGVIHQGDFEWTCPLRRVYCSQITSCEQAEFYLKYCKANYLDNDNDGIPCESICN